MVWKHGLAFGLLRVLDGSWSLLLEEAKTKSGELVLAPSQDAILPEPLERKESQKDLIARAEASKWGGRCQC